MTTSDDTRPGSTPASRRPSAFSIDEDAQGAARPQAAAPRRPASFAADIEFTPDHEDPFLADVSAGGDGVPPVARPRKRRFSFAGIAFSCLGILLSLAIGLWTDQLIRDLFSRTDWLGYAAVGVVVIGLSALAVAVLRELVAIRRLDAAQDLKAQAERAILSSLPAPARAVTAKLERLLASRAETARGRATLASARDDIIDGPHLIALAERELLGPLDASARALVLNASKRVSIVTAVSPRAVVDLAYVIYESARLVRAMAELYGARPGTFGLIRLMRDVLAHLAVTGSIAVGDSLVQQVLGHGIASRLSARLGEGVINGLMTARIGIAAMDLCRPLPFVAVKRPGIGDFIGDLAPSLTGRNGALKNREP